MVENVNGPTPSEYSFGRGARPSMELYPQPNEELDPLALKRAQLQTDTTDENAPLDFTGEYRGKDQFGRDLSGLEERGFTPIVREKGRGKMDERLDPLNPKAYEDIHGRGVSPNESWRNHEEADPIREGWEEGNFDPDVNAKTAAALQGTDPAMVGLSNFRSELLKKRRIVKRVAGPGSKLPWKGEADPRAKD